MHESAPSILDNVQGPLRLHDAEAALRVPANELPADAAEALDLVAAYVLRARFTHAEVCAWWAVASKRRHNEMECS